MKAIFPGIKNCIEGDKKIGSLAKKNNVGMVLEPVNSRVNEAMKGHPDFQGDPIDYCTKIVNAVN
ncbi:MAG TPA: hypothetical protein EYQ50_16610 [Verrucomicrobiales bacterium]|nr:hypothetical protein [Verrucomicrobiales bacterium]